MVGRSQPVRRSGFKVEDAMITMLYNMRDITHHLIKPPNPNLHTPTTETPRKVHAHEPEAVSTVLYWGLVEGWLGTEYAWQGPKQDDKREERKTLQTFEKVKPLDKERHQNVGQGVCGTWGTAAGRAKRLERGQENMDRPSTKWPAKLEESDHEVRERSTIYRGKHGMASKWRERQEGTIKVPDAQRQTSHKRGTNGRVEKQSA